MSRNVTFTEMFDILTPIDDVRNIRDKALMRQQAELLDAQLRELGWVHPVRCLDCVNFDCRSNGWGYCHSPALDGTGGPEMVVGYDDWCSFGEADDDGD